MAAKVSVTKVMHNPITYPNDNPTHVLPAGVDILFDIGSCRNATAKGHNSSCSPPNTIYEITCFIVVIET